MSLIKLCENPQCNIEFNDSTKSKNKRFCTKECYNKFFSEQYYNTPKGRYNLTKRCFTSKRGKHKGKQFLLTQEEYWDKTKDNECFYCSGSLSKTGINLDCIDPVKDYTIENTVPCCNNCNTLKFHNLTMEETIEIVKLLQKIRGKSKIWS